MLTTFNKFRTFQKVFAAHLLLNKNKCCGPLRKYAAMLVLLAAAHVYALADTAATVWQQLQCSRLHFLFANIWCNPRPLLSLSSNMFEYQREESFPQKLSVDHRYCWS